MKITRSFASDNNAGVHPKIMEAIQRANAGHVIGYGDDPFTEAAIAQFKEILGEGAEVFFVYGGTAANVLGLQAMLQSHQGVVCAESAHINVDECGAPEKFTGCKLIDLPQQQGKIQAEQIAPLMESVGFPHHVQPKVISISQPTEMGAVYTIDEIRSLSDFAHKNDMYLHMDGARIANAAVYLGSDFKSFTVDAGVDVLSFGGTKNGMMFGEALVFFDENLSPQFKYIRKQGMQLHSKMRFIAVQFQALLTDNLWRENARHANQMARLLESRIREIPEIQITQPVETNGVFAKIPRELIAPLQKAYFFYIWDEMSSEVRWMTAFDTTEADIDHFIEKLKSLL